MRRNPKTTETAMRDSRSGINADPQRTEPLLASNRLHNNHFHEPAALEPDVDPEELDELDEDSTAAAEETDSGSSPDDTLGLYLRQMGAIPLLNRKQELELAQRLERARQRYTH